MAAQTILRRTFGMELVELRRSVASDEVDKDAKNTDAVGMKKKGALWSLYHDFILLPLSKAAPSTKTWILRSALDPRLVSIATTPDDDIKAVEQEHTVDASDGGEDYDDSFLRSDNIGAILAWQSADHLSAIGILYVVLALVLVHGRNISDSTFSVRLLPVFLPHSSLL